MNRLVLTALRTAMPGAPPIGPLSLHVAAGDVLALVGPSGAGKTTLLRAIAGLVPATGSITSGADRVDHLPPEQRGLVYLHQSPRLFEHLDVLGNVTFPLTIRGVARSTARARGQELLAMVRLEGLAARGVAHLSGGERQRVALARAIAAGPRALLLDEPFAALDPGLRIDVRDALIALLGAAAPATILVTHELDEAGVLAGQIAVLLDGRVAQVDVPGRVFASPGSLAVATFLEIPNRWSAELAGHLIGTPPAGAATAVLPADAVKSTRHPAGDGTLIRVTPTRERRLAVVRFRSTELHSVVEGTEPAPGERVAITADPHRATWFNASGDRIAGG